MLNEDNVAAKHRDIDPVVKDLIRLDIPSDIRAAHKLCEQIVYSQPTYREALNKIVSYFLTDILITGGDPDDVAEDTEQYSEYRDYLEDVAGIRPTIHAAALDYLIYGTSLTSVIVPFRRFLRCLTCSFVVPFERVSTAAEFRFDLQSLEFSANCDVCNRERRFEVQDRRAPQSDGVIMRRWNPYEIDIIERSYSSRCHYYWRIPERVRKKVREGDRLQLIDMDWDVVKAIRNNFDFEFSDGVIHRMHIPAPAGIDMGGWGLSAVLANSRQAVYTQLLQRHNEAVASERILLPRVVVPETGVISDPFTGLQSMADIRRMLAMAYSQNKEDPGSVHFVPIPVRMLQLDDGTNPMVPKELLEYGYDVLLNAAGIPVDMYRGSLTYQTAPAAMRLFEAAWSHLVYGMNRMLREIVRNIGQFMQWQPVRARFARTSHADDLNKQMAKLQAAISGDISKTTGYASIGVDYAAEQPKILHEQQRGQELAMQAQEAAASSDAAKSLLPPSPIMSAASQQQAGQSVPQFQGMNGTLPGGGSTPAPGGGAVAGMPAVMSPQLSSIQELDAAAVAMAQQLDQMPETARKSQLHALRAKNLPLHAMVMSYIEQFRRDREVQGRAMLEGQIT